MVTQPVEWERSVHTVNTKTVERIIKNAERELRRLARQAKEREAMRLAERRDYVNLSTRAYSRVLSYESAPFLRFQETGVWD